ncbi:mitochondrial resolvase Ydc2 [Aspergillus oleicola]
MAPWLQGLKTKQLQVLAKRTGLPCSGSKSTIIAALEKGLVEYGNHQTQQKEMKRGKWNRKAEGEESWRILSIDMGIRNLAFAVLKVRGSDPTSSVLEMIQGKGGKGSASNLGSNTTTELTLRAWRRVSLPMDRGFTSREFKRYLDALGPDPDATPAPTSKADDVPETAEVSDGKTNTKAQEKGTGEAAKTSFSFSLEVYATHTHSILTQLLARYNPTHILIERQRFRSGGGAAVQEWSLRVGVFEGMLWAVLHSLNMEQLRSKRTATVPKVIAIEPSRVGRFWAPAADTGTDSALEEGKEEKKAKKSTSSREGKKLKIDLVGSWLEKDAFVISNKDGTREWVEGFMAKWKKSPSASSKSSSESKTKAKSKTTTKAKKQSAAAATVVPDVTKLDDLADCLVQGVTWLEWERTKGRILREGSTAVEDDGPA